MARKLSPLPSPATSPALGSNQQFDPVFYAYLKALEAVVSEQASHIETLRVALNEARQNPTTTYSPVAAF